MNLTSLATVWNRTQIRITRRCSSWTREPISTLTGLMIVRSSKFSSRQCGKWEGEDKLNIVHSCPLKIMKCHFHFHFNSQGVKVGPETEDFKYMIFNLLEIYNFSGPPFYCLSLLNCNSLLFLYLDSLHKELKDLSLLPKWND